jgi:hypothetical protein
MSGDERVRHCAQCHLNVYDLSAMTRAEAEALIEEAEGSLCVRLYRRADGTVLTADCPVGVAAARRFARRATASLGALVAAALGAMGLQGARVYAAEQRRLERQEALEKQAELERVATELECDSSRYVMGVMLYEGE